MDEYTGADDIRAAITAMREDTDTRWHTVADLLVAGPLGYAELIARRTDPTLRAKFIRDYSDAARGVAVARAYLGRN